MKLSLCPRPPAMKRFSIQVGALIIFAKYTVDTILQDPQYQGNNRDLDTVELFSGSEVLTRASRQAGWRAAPFDMLRSPQEDLTTEVGFLKALGLVMRLRAGALLWIGVVCSSWTFPNSSKHMRRKGAVEGNTAYLPVLEGNLMADIAALFMIICIKRGVECVVENPAGSQLFTYIQRWLRQYTLILQVCHRCAYDNDPYPRIGPKPYKFLSTGPWINNVNRKCQCPLLPGNEDKHRKCMEKTAAGGTSGTPAMAQSAAYPDELAAVIVQMWSQREPAIKPRSTSTHAQKEPRPEGSPQSSSASGAWGSDPESDTSAHGIRALPALGAEATRQLEKRARSVGSQKGCKKMQKAPVANPGHQIKHVKKRQVVEHTQAKFSPDGPWSSESESGAWSS